MRGISLLLAGILLLGGCSRPPALAPSRAPVARTGISSAQYASMNAFARDFLLAADKQSQARSFGAAPYGAYNAFSLFATAAEGPTLEHSAKALRIDNIVIGDLNDAVMSIEDDLYRTPETPFVSRNGVFMIWPIALTRDFVDQMRKDLGVDVIRLGSGGIGSQNRMNEWVSQGTQNRVPPMIDALSKEEVFLSLNPVVIDGAWERGFDPTLTEDRDFQGQSVAMMRRTGPVLLAKTDSYTAVTLPFRKSNLQATFLLPRPSDSPESLLGSLTPEQIKQAVSPTRETDITLHLPRFDIDTRLDLELLPEAAYLFRSPINLHYLSPELRGDYKMSAWKQHVVGSIREQGDPSPVKKSALETIAFDRPFLWLISDIKTNVVVAGGIYRGQDPKK